MPSLNSNTRYCHLVDGDNSDNLVILGSLKTASITNKASDPSVSINASNHFTVIASAGNITLSAASGLLQSAATSTQINSTTQMELQHDGTNRIMTNATGMGFFNATPVAKPTGVAVTAAAIHAALVSLGLIGA